MHPGLSARVGIRHRCDDGGIMSALLLFLALLPAAPGEVFRCVDAAGKVHYQDHACAGERATKLTPGADGRLDSGELRRWLTQFKGERRAASTPVPTGPSPAARSNDATAGPTPTISEGVLASCSQRFLDCANDSTAATDACVAQVPACVGARGSDCCPSISLSCYRGLRQSGTPLSSAMHAALLDPARCAGH
jgi:hypothetical protein